MLKIRQRSRDSTGFEIRWARDFCWGYLKGGRHRAEHLWWNQRPSSMGSPRYHRHRARTCPGSRLGIRPYKRIQSDTVVFVCASKGAITGRNDSSRSAREHLAHGSPDSRARLLSVSRVGLPAHEASCCTDTGDRLTGSPRLSFRALARNLYPRRGQFRRFPAVAPGDIYHWPLRNGVSQTVAESQSSAAWRREHAAPLPSQRR